MRAIVVTPVSNPREWKPRVIYQIVSMAPVWMSLLYRTLQA